jgi:hypothetical protein
VLIIVVVIVVDAEADRVATRAKILIAIAAKPSAVARIPSVVPSVSGQAFSGLGAYASGINCNDDVCCDLSACIVVDR